MQVEEDDYFNPDYVEVDRVLDLSAATDPVTGEASTHYLVKWRALPYEESTWELAQDVDKQKVRNKATHLDCDDPELSVWQGVKYYI